MSDNYNPNLGAYSAFQGLGDAVSDIGRMGLVDAMETRRSKMEHELRKQLKGDDQGFAIKQSDTANTRKVDAASIENTNKVDAATVKFSRDKKLEGIKGQNKTSASNKEMANKEMISPDGQTPVALDQVRKLYAESNGLNQEIIDWENVEPDFNKWSAASGFTWRNAKPVVPPKLVGITEDIARQRAMQQSPDASEEEVNQFIDEMRKEGLIVSGQAEPAAAPAPVEPDVMDAMASTADPQAAAVVFAGSKQPGVLDQVTNDSAPTKPVQPWKENKRKAAADREIKELSKYKSKAPAANRRGRTPAVQKAAKQATNAINKGNIKMVSKDNLKLALNDKAFVDGLTSEQIQQIKEYLNSGQ